MSASVAQPFLFCEESSPWIEVRDGNDTARSLIKATAEILNLAPSQVEIERLMNAVANVREVLERRQ